MSSKLRKAIGAMKDQTSISLAKVGNAANLEVAILKATTHDEMPMDDRYVNEILQMVSSNKVYAAACAQAIGKRITKTKDWVVALKSLMLVLRIFQDGDPYFPREVLHLMKRGVKILNLINFRDDSSSCPWDYTTFVRTFAIYLDERLDCFVTGKLQRRFNYHGNDYRKQSKLKSRSKRVDEPGIIDAKPSKLLDRISYWQRLLDRAIGTMPTGEAKMNRLIQISLYDVVQESFDLYCDISDGITLLLDSFFQLQYDSCIAAFQACVKSSNQFDELSSFYDSCKSIGVGRTSEYPCVQKVSEELIETLQDFLKDQPNSLPSQNSRSIVNKHLFLPATPRSTGSSSRHYGSYVQSEMSMRSSDFSTSCPSLEDLMFSADADGASPCRSVENYSENLEQYNEKQFEFEDCSARLNPSVSKQQSLSAKQATGSSIDLVFFDDWQQGQSEKPREQQQQQHGQTQRDCWELVLAEAATKTEAPFQKAPNGVDPFGIDDSFVSSSISYKQSYNPFLEDVEPVIPTPPVTTSNTVNQAASLPDLFALSSTFEYETPTFHAETSLGTKNMSPSPPPPTFIARSSSQNSMSTATSAQSLDLTSPTPSFGFQTSNLPMLPPTIVAKNGNETSVAPSFHAESFDDVIAVPTFSTRSFEETIASPTISATSFEETAATPTFSSRCLYNSPEAPTFSATSFEETKAAPTFSVRSFEETAAPTTFVAKMSGQMSSSQFESDPFGTGPSTITSEQQQQMWLEQQNKILVKRLAL